MRYSATRHPSDDELTLALDGELPGRRIVPLGDHLAKCAGCRARMQQIEETASAFVSAYTVHELPEATPPLSSRTRLAARMVELSKAEPIWSWRSVRVALQRGPLHSLLATLVVGAVLAVGSFRRGGGFGADNAVFVPREAGALPIAALTPGAVGSLQMRDACAGRPVAPYVIPAAVRASVVHGYGMDGVPAEEYELDFLITPALGGSPIAENLWPERYGSRVWNARVKDQLEDRLLQLVCQGSLDLQTAQREMATDWIAAYRKYFRTDRPLRSS